MRKRERDEVTAVARRRLEALSVELAALRAERDGPAPEDPVGDVSGVTSGGTSGGASAVADAPGGGLGPAVGAGAPAFFETDEPVLAGPPGDLPGGVPAWETPAWAAPVDPAPVGVVQAPVGRPLPPARAGVPAPGRHAVARPGEAAGERVEGWLDDRLPDVVRRRVALSGQHLLVLTGVLGVALAVAGFLTLRGGGGEEVAPRATFVSQRGTDVEPSAAGSAGPSASSSPGAGASASSGGGTVVVDVAGKVRRPGIVTLPAGSRVHDAIERAGGVVGRVSTTSLNLARVLTDGEQVLVGVPLPAGASTGSAGPAGGAGSTGSAGATTAGALVNLNTAGLAELDTLPGVGPVTAQKILDWRTAHGAFSSVDELLEVDGIGDKTLADIKPRATL